MQIIKNSIKPIFITATVAAVSGIALKYASKITLILSSTYSIPHTVAATSACFLTAILIDKLIGHRLNEFSKIILATAIQGTCFYGFILLEILPLTISAIAPVVAGLGFIIYKLATYEKEELIKRTYEKEELIKRKEELIKRNEELIKRNEELIKRTYEKEELIKRTYEKEELIKITKILNITLRICTSTIKRNNELKEIINKIKEACTAKLVDSNTILNLTENTIK